MAGIRIIHPGMLTTVQDLGRFGYQQFGVSACGAVDPRALRFSNILVDNEEGEAALEITMMGTRIEFQEDNIFAIAGADLGAKLEQEELRPYKAYLGKKGQILRFLKPVAGLRAYLAFAGGLELPPVMGSRSTDMKAHLGGFQGRKLEKDDMISFRAPKLQLRNLELRAIAPEFQKRAEYTLRVILGPQDDAFTEKGIETFLQEGYTLTPEFDRMGCRLDGAEIEHKDSADIISDGIAFGAIQVPSSGRPIIMLSDRQTTGGYTKIATVISADFRILGQLKAGDRVRFQKVSVSTAQEALLAERAALRLFRYAFRQG